MGKRFARFALAAALSAGAGAALAQTIPEGQSCGGLLCDMGVFGHKTEPKVEAKPAEAKVETKPAPVAARAPVTSEPRRVAHARARPAKVAARPPAPRPKVARVEARPATPTPFSAAAQTPLMAPASMTMPPSRAAPPPPPPPVVIINPYSSMGVSATQFRPVDPRY